jgi:hypothetical protein
MKKCSKCKQKRPFKEFYKNKRYLDGYQGVCKSCQRDYLTPRESVCEYCNRSFVVENENNLGYFCSKSCAGRSRRTIARIPGTRHWAHKIVHEAVRKGVLTVPLRCETCNKWTDYPLHGHHDDVTKPLDVTWLCVPCHKKRDKELKEIKSDLDIDYSKPIHSSTI